MTDNQLKMAFSILNYSLGVFIAIMSLKLFTKKGLTAPIYITAAIVVVGPIENLLMRIVKPEDRWLVDQLTSVAFLIFLLLAVLESGKSLMYRPQ
ncbi:MAG: hypothetical protein PHE70_04220 [Tepidanaerobacteraceae bacterium]|nr:hypothetical protein [Tepidanaerobacteraceae bacterium]